MPVRKIIKFSAPPIPVISGLMCDVCNQTWPRPEPGTILEEEMVWHVQKCQGKPDYSKEELWAEIVMIDMTKNG